MSVVPRPARIVSRVIAAALACLVAGAVAAQPQPPQPRAQQPQQLQAQPQQTQPQAPPALDLRALAGWWIAIDDTFPKLAEAGVAPAEEILIVNADGRFENRVMNFSSGTADVCAERRICSDLPAIARGRLRVASGQLALLDRRATTERLDSAKADPLIRAASLASLPGYAVSGGNGLIVLQSAAGMRTLARIKPQRLTRLRAGMRAAGLPPEKHWRCFLANATANDAAFALLRKDAPPASPPSPAPASMLPPLLPPAAATAGAPAAVAPPPLQMPPDFLDRYLRVASYLITLDTLMKTPTIDDPAGRGQIGSEPEQLLVEEFPGATPPNTAADVQRLGALVAAVETRVRAKMKELSGGGPTQPSPGTPLISDAEIMAFAQAASDSEAARKLFCRD
jgi:hypothetical protein